jgi:hypothetical protein
MAPNSSHFQIIPDCIYFITLIFHLNKRRIIFPPNWRFVLIYFTATHTSQLRAKLTDNHCNHFSSQIVISAQIASPFVNRKTSKYFLRKWCVSCECCAPACVKNITLMSFERTARRRRQRPEIPFICFTLF